MYANYFKHKDVTNKIIKGFFEVYNELGYGFLESVYENALHIVLEGYGLSVQGQKDISVYFRGYMIGEFRADLIVNEKVMIEIKAVDNLASAHEAQLINYLKSTNIEVGLLLNFGKKPNFKRFAFDNKRKEIRANLRSSAAEE
jgi:GxxExxY protein